MIEHAVLIAAADLLPTMKSRLAPEARDLIAFSDAEALRALEVITTRRPGVVMLERKFASTPRGAALINRIKADPSLAETRIDIVVNEDQAAAEAPAAPARPAGTPATKIAAHATQAATATATPAPTLDFRGTRRAPRTRLPDTCEILVDGNRGTIVDLSTGGAQIVTTHVLKPNQRVRVSIADDHGTVRCSATVVWAAFEIPKGIGPRYRAGLELIEPDTKAIGAYIQRHTKA